MQTAFINVTIALFLKEWLAMQIGLMLSVSDDPSDTLEKVVENAKTAETEGFSSLWMANIFGLDAVTTLAIIGQATESILLGTAVTPTYPRHPTALAQQALTTGAACQGRFTLGIGLSHQVVIENMLGLSYSKPARHMKEYLAVLLPLLRGETVSYQGEHYQVNQIKLAMPGQTEVPTLVAALGPVMLKLAGQQAQGTITWMTGPKTLEQHIIPSINAAAAEAGKPAARIAAGFPVLITNNEAAAREQIGKSLQIYGMLPSYRAMLDREGIAGPQDLALVGSEAAVRTAMARLRDLGVTEFCAAISADNAEEQHRTRAFLASECQ
jgi:F420-dependent oxidoreductase-like protein